MLARLIAYSQKARIGLRFGMKVLAWAVWVILISLAVEVYLWPWLSTNATLQRWHLIHSTGERLTVVERRETVAVSQDENFERLLAEHGSIVARVTELPTPEHVGLADRIQAAQSLPATFVTNDGILVTSLAAKPAENQHWIAWLHDGTAAPAKWIGYDSLTNLAFLRVERDNTPAAAFTNPNDLHPGRRLVLFGTTPEAQPTVMATVLEALDRTFNLSPQTVSSADQWEGVLRIAGEPSTLYVGGPAMLVNGEMAGIVSARTVDHITQAFVVPPNAVRRSLDRIIAGQDTRPMIGLYYLSLTPERSAVLGVERDRGALVYSPSGRTGLAVLAGTPAARAGLQFGDIITAVNGEEINLDLPLSVALSQFNQGDTVSLKVLRGNVEQEITLSL